MKILAIDWGRKRMGLALSREGFAPEILSPLERLTLDEVVKKIQDLCLKNNVTEIVIGLPLKRDGTPSKNTAIVKELGQRLKESEAIKGIKITFIDEVLTTKMAETQLRTSGFGKKHVKKKRDSTAAALLLDEYLNSR